jgi:hypothetical protein
LGERRNHWLEEIKMAQNLPYVLVGGTLAKILEKIKTASVPARFTQDFLSTKLGFKAGNAKAVIPFFKRIGFLGPDGAPTDLYKRFRNPAHSGAAMAEAIRTGFAGLYEMNEYVHSATDGDLKGLVVQATGAEPNSRVVQAIVSSFKTLKGFGNFDAPMEDTELEEEEVPPSEAPAPLPPVMTSNHAGLNLSYTINLNLPATTDIKVFDALFKSLREHLLRR